eukprot:CAMPEP_0119261506 /NCGR_PEP_ID=MMETSP1329-20130426/1553_1 /TAXON_ID=114041 /ORGANISM="Genus nov. species nov., Strain RCC1024" /LENGTH=79 /DNA_ID=CAMNT_0007261071 /DNA_START=235 /DNA_END=471 /DNA_ORIENTATION=-
MTAALLSPPHSLPRSAGRHDLLGRGDAVSERAPRVDLAACAAWFSASQARTADVEAFLRAAAAKRRRHREANPPWRRPE